MPKKRNYAENRVLNIETKTEKNFKAKEGFTFIELLIVITTMSLVFGLGFANYRGYQDRQRLVAATLMVKSDLRYAQAQALSGIKPTGCTSLYGYKLENINSTSYRIRANCDGIPGTDYTVKTITITDKYPLIRFNPTFSNVYFNVLGRGVRVPLTITLEDTKTSTFQQISVTIGGEIN